MEIKRMKKPILLLLSLLLIIGVAVGGTAALLTVKLKPLQNTFYPAVVDCTVTEMDGAYTVTNQGNIPAYIRVAVVANWTRDGQVYGLEPITAEDYRITAADGWTLLNGYYYYTQPVAPGAAALPVVVSPVGEAPEGCVFSVCVLAEAIQSEPVSAAQEAWGFPAR